MAPSEFSSASSSWSSPKTPCDYGCDEAISFGLQVRFAIDKSGPELERIVESCKMLAIEDPVTKVL
jgi:hypothetical protein